MRHLILIVYSFCFLCSWATNGQKRTPPIHGISFVASPNPIDKSHIDPLVKLGANWAAIMPFGFIKSLAAPKVAFNIDRQWWGEREEGVTKTSTLLQDQSIKIMLKPQLWVWEGSFTGAIEMQSEEDWVQLEKSYQEFILFYAKIAEKRQIKLFCIGTELEAFIQARPAFWNSLIKNIRAIYSGELTYASNWDEATKVPFWCELDYIGIDAYYPIATSETPTVKEAKLGWQRHKKSITGMQKLYDLPVLFTEYGYRSVDFSGKEPWKSDRIAKKVNVVAQENLLTALYEEFEKESWFAGGFLWKWYHEHSTSGGLKDNRFTIQNKPAEKTVADYFAR